MTTFTRKAGLIAMVLVLASTVAASAQPRRGWGGGGFSHGPGFHGGFAGGPRFNEGFHGRLGFRDAFGGRVYFGAGYYDPFWGGFYPYGLFPFAYYPYSAYAYGMSLGSEVKVKVTPKHAQVFVDGYYAGEADQFDGAFQGLHVTPGGHEIAVYLSGYRTESRDIYAAPKSTVTFRDAMTPLRPGEVSEPPAAPESPAIAPVEPTAPAAARQ